MGVTIHFSAIFTNGWKFVNGKPVKIVKLVNGNNLDVVLKSGSGNCNTYYYAEYTQNCVTTFGGTSNGGETTYTNNGTECSDPYLSDYYEWEECDYSSDSFGSDPCSDYYDPYSPYSPYDPYYNPNYNGAVYDPYYSQGYYDPYGYDNNFNNPYDPCIDYSGGSSGGSGGYTPPAVSLEPTLKLLFIKGTTLTSSDMEKLNNAFLEMIEKCFYSYISDELERNNVVLGAVSIESGMMGSAAVTSKGNLKFENSDAITAENLEHEWVHLYQRKISNVDIFDYTNNMGMAEFELALLEDIKIYVSLNGDITTSTHSWSCFKTGNIDNSDEYVAWLNSLTSNGTTYPSGIDGANFRKFADIFGDVSIGYNKSKGFNYSNPTYEPVSISQLLSNCK